VGVAVFPGSSTPDQRKIETSEKNLKFIPNFRETSDVGESKVPACHLQPMAAILHVFCRGLKSQ
jgi:hypothetical protein